MFTCVSHGCMGQNLTAYIWLCQFTCVLGTVWLFTCGFMCHGVDVYMWIMC